MIEHVETNLMLVDSLIKDLTHKVFHMIVVIKNAWISGSLFCFMLYIFVLVLIQTLCYDFLQK